MTSATGWRSESYSYDNTGNRTNTGYTTTTGNELTSDGTYNYTYDNEGNLVTQTKIATGDVSTYTYDNRNRLTDVTTKTSGGVILSEATYTYDVNDNRIQINDNGPVTRTVYDGGNAWADYDSSNAVKGNYLYGRGLDQILARLDSRGIAWYLTDLIGSVRDIANTSGTVIDHVKCDSFGKVLSESNSGNGDRFKFTAREYDSVVISYYYRARYYSPSVGRFATQDPTGFAPGDANLYRYVSNAPILRPDASGLDPELIARWAERREWELARKWRRNELNKRLAYVASGQGVYLVPVPAPLGYGHVVVVVGPCSDGRYHTYEGGGAMTSYTPTPVKDYPGWTIPGPPADGFTVNNPYGGPDQARKHLDEAWNRMPAQLPYSPLGPNSNTFARGLIENAGFTSPPGVNYNNPGWYKEPGYAPPSQ